MTPSWRKALGMLGILAFIGAWVVLIASFSDALARLAWPLQLIFYLIAGIVWITPLKPALRWMETGRWRGVR